MGTKGFAGAFMFLKLSLRTANVWDGTLPSLSREGVNYLCTVSFSSVIYASVVSMCFVQLMEWCCVSVLC